MLDAESLLTCAAPGPQRQLRCITNWLVRAYSVSSMAVYLVAE